MAPRIGIAGIHLALPEKPELYSRTTKRDIKNNN